MEPYGPVLVLGSRVMLLKSLARNDDGTTGGALRYSAGQMLAQPPVQLVGWVAGERK